MSGLGTEPSVKPYKFVWNLGASPIGQESTPSGKWRHPSQGTDMTSNVCVISSG
jgi:hypothetical protein